MGPLAYYNEDMEGQFRTGLSYMLQQMTYGLNIILTYLQVSPMIMVSAISLRSHGQYQWRTPCLR